MKDNAVLLTLALASCSPITPESPNPLDSLEDGVLVAPAPLGRFGPHSEFYNTHYR